jgi:hypothetical protein
MRKLFLFLMSMILSIGYACATIYYVKQDIDGGDDFEDGLSWETAFATIKWALTSSEEEGSHLLVSGDEIWVAGGTYDCTFTVTAALDGVAIYGGFAGTETSVNDRAKTPGGKAWDFANPTVLQPEEGGATVFNAARAGTFAIDGFIFQSLGGNSRAINYSTGANAGGYVIRNCMIREFASGGDGGGLNIRAKTEIGHCLITGNSGVKGGGGYFDYSTIHDCVITNNSVSLDAENPLNSGAGGGGGLLLAASTNIAYNCWIEGNSASFGGGVVVRAGSVIYNSIIVDNTASKSGGGISFDQRDNGGTVYNVTIANNTAESAAGAGGVCFAAAASAGERIQNVYNTIFYNNTTGDAVTNIGVHLTDEGASVAPNFKNNIIDGAANYANFTITIGDDCVFESTAANLFVDTEDYVTSPNFPGRNKGLSEGIGLPGTDMAGNPRVIKNAVDIGPFEIEELEQAVVPNANGVIFVDKDIIISDDPYVVPTIGNSWATALASPTVALAGAVKYLLSHPGERVQLWIKAGTYENISIELKDGISLYGGFAGTETSLSGRAKGAKPWEYTNATILSGVGRARTSGSDAVTSNAVLRQADLFTSPVVIDGLTLTNGEHGAIFVGGGNTTLRNSILKENGNAAAVTTSNVATGIDGGGVAIRGGSYRVVDCLIENNEAKSGGGVIIANGSSSIVVERCTIRNNKALVTTNALYNYVTYLTSVFGWGGGVFNQGGIVNNCLIEGNRSFVGGGILVRNNDSQFNNCIVVNNSALFGGGVGYEVRDADTHATFNGGVVNCLFANNSVTGESGFEGLLNGGTDPITSDGGFGGGVCFTYPTQQIYNSIFTGNKADGNVSVSQGGFEETLNFCVLDDPNESAIDSYPAGTITYDADWKVTSLATFPGIDAGYDFANPTESDYAGNERIYGGGIDIGPYEYDAPPYVSAIAQPATDVQGTLIGVRYYNLQGVELKQPVRGEIYIEQKLYDNQKTEVRKGLFLR